MVKWDDLTHRMALIDLIWVFDVGGEVLTIRSAGRHPVGTPRPRHDGPGGGWSIRPTDRPAFAASVREGSNSQASFGAK